MFELLSCARHRSLSVASEMHCGSQGATAESTWADIFVESLNLITQTVTHFLGNEHSSPTVEGKVHLERAKGNMKSCTQRRDVAAILFVSQEMSGEQHGSAVHHTD